MLMTILNRSTLVTASLYTMIIMALIFNKVFLALGGGRTIDALALIISEATAPIAPLLMLLVLLVGLVGLGMVFDWLIMALIILPFCIPVFAHCDFGARLAAFWPAATSEGSREESFNALISFPFFLPVRLWLAALAWTALLSALVTFSRQNGEVAQKELVSWTGKIKDSPASMGLFLVLQIVGLIAIIIVPQLVLWLPSVIVE
jgi:TRAP-type mannitol/chloroaromatic compound transport system permease large subunit